jgi:hypothetical protein
MKETCVTCKYSEEGYHGLECRAKPPTYNYKNPSMRAFPFVQYNDWCAKYKAKEEQSE